MSKALEMVQRLSRDTRGAGTTEYVFLVGLVALGLILTLVAVGPTFVERYQLTRNQTASPFP